jgi:hypothetical protein
MHSGFSDLEPRPSLMNAGFRFGDRGTHTSRTIMLAEMTELLAVVPRDAHRGAYAAAIIEDNVLGKATTSTRRLTNQRLGELYALDPAVSVFRLFRRLWDVDERGRPLLALYCALARDPLLRATAKPIHAMPIGTELARQQMTDAIREAVGDRLNDEILDKVVRNASSSWTQSGHLQGRGRKIRRKVDPTPTTITYALLLGYLLGLRGILLFKSPWCRILDAGTEELIAVAGDAKRLGLLDLKHAGDVVEIGFPALLTEEERRQSHGAD